MWGRFKNTVLSAENGEDNSTKLAALLIAPALAVMGFIIVYPLLEALWLSFFNYQLTKPDEYAFAMSQNYGHMLKDDVFWIALKNTVFFTFATVFIGLLLGLLMALAIDHIAERFASIRGLILIPWVVPGIVVGYLFMYMFDVEVGIINYFLLKANIISKYIPWLMKEDLSMIAVIAAHVWNQAPFYMLMITAGLKAIPDDVKEAAYMEGASRWEEFCHVTLPYLKGILVISSLLMIIRNFNNFPIIWTMTGGGPVYATTTSVIYIYREAFEQYNLGYASAVGVVWVAILLVVSVVYVRSLQKDF